MRLLFLFAALAATVLAQQQPWETAAGGKKSFDVTSVKPVERDAFHIPSFPLDSGEAFVETGGRFTAVFPLRVYVQFAYKLNLTPEAMTAAFAGMPKWVGEQAFEIEAKAADPNTAKDQFRLMMQSLLADRFRLAVHFETKIVPAFAMMPAKPGKTGPQLRPHPDGTACDKAPCGAFVLTKKREGLHAESHGTTMDSLAEGMTTLGRPVVNQSGLGGKFDFSLDWAPDSPDTQSEAPGLIAAIREQLGLKLEPTKAPVRMIVIDHLERPTEN